MTDREKLLEAARLLQDFCVNEMERACFTNHCPFCAGEVCMFGEPASWHIPKLRRWTDEDVDLAKSLFNFGAEHIYKKKYGTVVAFNKHGDGICGLRCEAFAELKNEETVYLREIITEGEQV